MPVEEKARQPSTATAVADPPPAGDKKVIQVDAELWAEMHRKQDAMQRLLEQILAERSTSAPTPNVLRPAATAKSLPPNYVVWLGPEPRSGDLYLGARGRVTTINADTQHKMLDGDGQGKERTIRGQECAIRTTEYSASGTTSIEFTRRCPAHHKYAGRLFAELECPEHAAYLHLTTPDGKGNDREGNKLYAFHLLGDWITKYKSLVRYRMNLRKADEESVDWVASDGVDMPLED